MAGRVLVQLLADSWSMGNDSSGAAAQQRVRWYFNAGVMRAGDGRVAALLGSYLGAMVDGEALVPGGCRLCLAAGPRQHGRE